MIAELNSYEISILINNAGYADMWEFKTQNFEELDKILFANVMWLTYLCRGVVPNMVDRKQQSAIVNVGSISSEVPFPGIPVYAGSKAYVQHFTACLATELKAHGVDVMCISPGFVSTNMSGHMKLSLLTITAQYCAQGTLRDLGHESYTHATPNHDFVRFQMKTMDAVFPQKFEKRMLD